ncbi:MAG: PorT family protein [Bacteroidales bacterium]|nr:PorT family protein [Bacteroidales bacterium]
MIRDLFFTLLFFVLIGTLSAQHRDTVYVERETVTYDTVTVYDTVRVHDTLNIADYLRSEEFERLFYSSEYVGNLSLTDSMKEKLLRQTVTFWENRVLQNEQQTFSSMDSIKKYGLAGLIILGLNAMSPAQTDSTTAGKPHDPPKKHKTHLFNSQMNGFHLGYTIQYDLIEPIFFQDYVAGEPGNITHSSPRHGLHAGVEFSYNFADYFGVSAALNLGTLGFHETIQPVYHYEIMPYGRLYKATYGLSIPLKFEFHYPIRDNLLFTTSAGVRIRIPFRTFAYGFSHSEGIKETQKNENPSVYQYSLYDRNIIYADIMFDAGIYYRLPNEDYLRFTIGLNAATTDFMNGEEHYTDHLVQTLTSPDIEVSHRNNHLYFQIAYIQSFNKKRKIIQAQPHWSTFDGMHHRHEVRFEVGDPLGIMILHKNNHLPNISGSNLTAVGHAWRATPVFSFNYHYRLTKWLWAGAMVNYAYYRDHTDYTYQVYNMRWMHCITLMPELRFSYLNRPHVTLYSAVAAGATLFVGHENPTWEIYDGQWWKHSTFPSFQLTAFGVRAGGEHLFGSFELGVGIKGFASAGIGYAF